MFIQFTYNIGVGEIRRSKHRNNLKSLSKRRLSETYITPEQYFANLGIPEHAWHTIYEFIEINLPVRSFPIRHDDRLEVLGVGELFDWIDFIDVVIPGLRYPRLTIEELQAIDDLSTVEDAVLLHSRYYGPDGTISYPDKS